MTNFSFGCTLICHFKMLRVKVTDNREDEILSLAVLIPVSMKGQIPQA